MTPKLLRRIFIGTLLGIFIFSCSSNKTDQNKNKQDLTIEVSMLKFEFIPKILTIKAGQTVRWINKEKRQYHSVWFEQQGEQESDYLFPDDSLSKQFNTPGRYPYRCGPHPEMVATIIVE